MGGCPQCDAVKKTQADIDSAYISFFNTYYAGIPIDIYMSGSQVSKGLMYKQSTQYMKVPSGRYNIKIYAAGKNNGIINTDIMLERGRIYTAAPIGDSSGTGILLIDNPLIIPSGNTANIRFAHLAPGTPCVDLTSENGEVIIDNICYKGVSGFAGISPGQYTLHLTNNNTGEIIMTIPNVRLQAGLNHTITAVSNPRDIEKPQVLISAYR